MNSVKIWNRNTFAYFENFKGEAIKIGPGGYTKMDYNEAVLFLGTFRNPEYSKSGIQKPESFKWLEIDKDDKRAYFEQARSNLEDEKAEKVFACHACMKEFRTKNGLLKHIKDKHQTDMVDKEARDELLDNEDLQND